MLGNEEEKNQYDCRFKERGGVYQASACKNLNLRNTPQITFVLDTSIEYGVTMAKKISDLQSSEPAREEEADE